MSRKLPPTSLIFRAARVMKLLLPEWLEAADHPEAAVKAVEPDDDSSRRQTPITLTASRPNSQRGRHHREGLKVCGLSGGGKRIRTLGSAAKGARLHDLSRRLQQCGWLIHPYSVCRHMFIRLNWTEGVKHLANHNRQPGRNG